MDEAATIFEEELDADQERQESGKGVSHAGMKRKAESDGPELKAWMFGRFGYLQAPKYEPPSRKKTLGAVQ